MKRRAGPGGGGHGAAGGASSRRGDRDGEGRGGREGNDGRDGEGKLRIHLKRSCTDRKVVQGETELGLTTDGETGVARDSGRVGRNALLTIVKSACQGRWRGAVILPLFL